MPERTFGPRKRRSWQHKIADLSVHHVERFILEAGHTTQRLGSDYGYDLIMNTFDENGYVEPGSVYFQFKAAGLLKKSRTGFVQDLDIRDYNLWVMEKMPVVLILYDASRGRAYWLAVQEYFTADPSRRPIRGAKHIRIHVPANHLVNRRAIAKMRALKWAAIRQEEGEK